MMNDLKPYPSYRDSGVEWLGDVPDHWGVEPIGRIGQLFKGNGGSKEDEVPSGVPCVRYGDLYTKHEFFIRTSRSYLTPTQAAAYTSIRHGDLLFAASGETIEDIGRSAINLIETEACCGGDILVLRPKVEVVSKYLGYAADSTPSRRQKACMGRGFTVIHVYAAQLKRLSLPLPSLSEQIAIVRFLDHADRQIRRYIRAKQKLLKLLEEQKHAIIQRAVTRGLNPDVRLKRSGVEWLGEVPEHWEITRLERVIADGPRNGVSTAVGERGTIESFSISAVCDAKVDIRPEDRKYIVGDKAVLERTYRLLRGDVLLVRGNGNIRLVGRAGVVEDDRPGGVYPDLLMRIRLTASCLPHYLVALLNSAAGREQIETAARTAVGTFKINNQHVRRLCFALPPVAEQEWILTFLSAELRGVEIAMRYAADHVTLLREYRTRLIADVVTGKLDVRTAAASLPHDEIASAELPELDDDPLESKEADDDEFAAELAEVGA